MKFDRLLSAASASYCILLTGFLKKKRELKKDG